MCYKNFWTKLIPFSMALIFGLATVNVLQKQNSPVLKTENQKTFSQATFYSGNGTGSSGSCFGKSSTTSVDDKSSKTSSIKAKGVTIISKPRANYTDAARQNEVQGTVKLRVTFKSNGEIGSISPIDILPYGLTEQAIEAARGIEFEPAEKSGIPQTVTKQVQYTFTLY